MTYYVYGHWTLDTNELFYIGAGSKRRLYGGGRNKLWNEIAMTQGYEAIIIIGGFTCRDEAVKEEIRLQRMHKPRACLRYGDNFPPVMSEETRAKLSRANTGKKISEDQRVLLSIANKGRKHGDKHKRKNDGSKWGAPVINCRGQVFDTATDAAKAFGSQYASSIAKCAKGGRKSAGKYPDGNRVHWGYNDGTPVIMDNSKTIYDPIKAVINCRGQVFDTVKLASRTFNLRGSAIHTNIRGKQKSAGKYPDGEKIKWYRYTIRRGYE